MESSKRPTPPDGLALTPGAPPPPLPDTNLFVWGCNSNSQLGHMGGDRVSATLSKCSAFFSHVAAGTSHTVAITASGEARILLPPTHCHYISITISLPPSQPRSLLAQSLLAGVLLRNHHLTYRACRSSLGATMTAANSVALPPSTTPPTLPRSQRSWGAKLRLRISMRHLMISHPALSTLWTLAHHRAPPPRPSPPFAFYWPCFVQAITLSSYFFVFARTVTSLVEILTRQL
jgi:hypothetical protein